MLKLQETACVCRSKSADALYRFTKDRKAILQGDRPKGDEWVYIDNPISQVRKTHGQMNTKPEGMKTPGGVPKQMERELAESRSKEVKEEIPKGENQWSAYPQKDLAGPHESGSAFAIRHSYVGG